MIIHETRSKEWPDPGIPCCMGSAALGPGHCTCWEPVFDSETSEPWDGSTPSPAFEMCHDCAYRKDSPERTGDEGYSGDEEHLFHIAEKGEKFYCHQGVRKVLYYRHPSGLTVPGHPADFDRRLVEKNGERFPIKSDGSAANICGGWCKMRSQHLKTLSERSSNG